MSNELTRGINGLPSTVEEMNELISQAVKASQGEMQKEIDRISKMSPDEMKAEILKINFRLNELGKGIKANDEANATESANSTKMDKGNANNGFMNAVLQNQFRR